MYTGNHCCVAADRRGVEHEDLLQLHHVGAHSVFCCPHCGLIADRDAQATKNILGHGLSVRLELDPDLYKQCIHGTSLAGGADGGCIPARA
jgi:transposase